MMSTVGSKILLPRTEEGTSVAVGTVSIQPLNSPVEICGCVCEGSFLIKEYPCNVFGAG